MICKCKICNRKFNYDGEESPMLNNLLWNKIVKFYNLENYEKEASNRFIKAYKKKQNIEKDNQHLFICIDCMENALNRRLTKEDLIGDNIPYNKTFEEWYFK